MDIHHIPDHVKGVNGYFSTTVGLEETLVIRRVMAALAAVAALGAIVATTAVPAHASPVSFTVANCGAALNGQTFSVPTGTVFGAIGFTTPCQANTPPATPNPTQNPPNFAISSSPSFNWYDDEIRVNGAIQIVLNYSGGSPTNVTIQLSNTVMMAPIADGTYTVYFASFPTNTTPVNAGSFTIVVGAGGGGGGASSSSASAPVLETLTISATTNDTTCTGGSPTGYTGSWLQLPAADQCSQSGPNANPNAKLLGWATDPIFPVAVAQQIVDLKYGPIDDYFYGMRMIFIPAGGWTYISSSNTLYPIWAS